MKILVAHNGYIHRGGEDVCVDHEIAALKHSGIQVIDYRVRTTPDLKTIARAGTAPWGGGYEAVLEATFRDVRPDLVHVHNLFPLLSPRFFRTVKEKGTPVVLTLHNYRPLCLNGLFLTPRHEICERCSNGNFLPGILRGCYRGNRFQSLGMAAHLTASRVFDWYDQVDRFIAPSLFLKNKFVQAGFPESKMIVQGHFLPDWEEMDPITPLPYVLYLGRLSEEKGIRWLLKIFQKSPNPIDLHIAGDGPCRPEVEKVSGGAIRYLGFLQGDAKRHELQHASAVVIPSQCYENFPLAVMEANSYGTPVLVSRIGGLAEITESGINGKSFLPDNPASFWNTLKELLAVTADLDKRQECQQFAREHFSQQRFLAIRTALYSELILKPGAETVNQ